MEKHTVITFFDVLLACTLEFLFQHLKKNKNKNKSIMKPSGREWRENTVVVFFFNFSLE